MFLKISIPADLRKNPIPCLYVGEKMLSKMKQFEDVKGRAQRQKVPQSEGKSIGKTRAKGQRKMSGPASKQPDFPPPIKVYSKKKKLLLHDESDEAEAEHFEIGRTAETVHEDSVPSTDQAPVQGENPPVSDSGYDQSAPENV